MLRALLPATVAVAEADESDRLAPLHPLEARLATADRERRRQFAAGRSCARRALSRIGRPDAAVPTGPAGEPRWPPGVVGAITHTAGYCAAAVASCARVRALGVDAERALALDEGAARAVLSEEERRRLPAGPAWPAVAFSAKESLFKAWFPLAGRPLRFHEAEVGLDPLRGAFVARLLVPPPSGAAEWLSQGVEGRFAITARHVFTAIAVPARTAV
jgi:4'-phosphopantetheinyl transferase EntD